MCSSQRTRSAVLGHCSTAGHFTRLSSADWWLGLFKHRGARREGGNEVGGWRSLRLPSPPPFLSFRSGPAYRWSNSDGVKTHREGSRASRWDSDDLLSVCTAEEVGPVGKTGPLWSVFASLLPASASVQGCSLGGILLGDILLVFLRWHPYS